MTFWTRGVGIWNATAQGRGMLSFESGWTPWDAVGAALAGLEPLNIGTHG